MAKINVISLLYFLSLWKFPQLSFQGLQVSYNDKIVLPVINIIISYCYSFKCSHFWSFSSYVIFNFFFHHFWKLTLWTVYSLYLPNFSWVECMRFLLFNVQNFQKCSHDFQRFPMIMWRCQTLPKMSQDVQMTFEHFRSYLKGTNLVCCMWYSKDTK